MDHYLTNGQRVLASLIFKRKIDEYDLSWYNFPMSICEILRAGLRQHRAPTYINALRLKKMATILQKTSFDVNFPEW